MLLSVIITKILGARPPVDKELALTGPILDPIKTHVDCLGAFLFDGVICKALGSRVVYLHWSGRLGMTEFFERGTDGYSFRAVDVGCSNFGFGGRSHDVAHDSGDGEKWTIQGRGVDGRLLGGSGETAEEVVSASTAAGHNFREVTGIAMDV